MRSQPFEAACILAFSAYFHLKPKIRVLEAKIYHKHCLQATNFDIKPSNEMLVKLVVVVVVVEMQLLVSLD